MKVSKEIAQLFCHYSIGTKAAPNDESDEFYNPHLVTLLYRGGGHKSLLNRGVEEDFTQFGKFCRGVADALDPIDDVTLRGRLLIKAFMLGQEYQSSHAPNSMEAEMYLMRRGLIS